jgi:hypothetical protein
MDTWQFYQNDAGLWCWRHTAQTGISEESKQCFESRTDCIANAMNHGYLARSGMTMAPAGRRFALAWR